jgi:hypothetical protein
MGILDFAPTFLRLLDLPYDALRGRVLSELIDCPPSSLRELGA